MNPNLRLVMFIFIFSFVAINSVSAQQSESYQLIAWSYSSGGSSAINSKVGLQGIIGQPVASTAQSINFQLRSGYQTMLAPRPTSAPTSNIHTYLPLIKR